MGDNQNHALWVPDPADVAATNMAAFTARARILSGRPLENQAALHEWSVHSPVPFWRLVWEFCEVLGDQGVRGLIRSGGMQDSRWFPDASLNFAENLLRDSGNPRLWCSGAKTRLSRVCRGRCCARWPALPPR
jgi:acetoacetyl-CoA synthetase